MTCGTDQPLREQYLPSGRSAYRTSERNRYRFIGVERDVDTGLCMTGPRTYDPLLGRFLQPDPLVQPGEGPFVYASGNPVGRLDPGGYADCSAVQCETKPFDPREDRPHGPTLEELDQAAFVPDAYAGGRTALLEGVEAMESWAGDVVSLAFARANLPSDPETALSVTLAVSSVVSSVSEGEVPSAWATLGLLSGRRGGRQRTGSSGLGRRRTVGAPSMPDSPTFATSSKLNDHFARHGREFGLDSADDYQALAQEVMRVGDKVQYEYKNGIRTGYVAFMGANRKGKAKFAFVGTNKHGDITTLHTKSGKDVWRTLNNNPRDQTVRPAP